MSVRANNPILPGFYPDPSIVAVGDDYYIVNSSFAYFPGLPVMHSKDLANWEQIGNALNRVTQLPVPDNQMSRGILAPTIRYHEGIFYIVCTNSAYGGNFIITAKDPKGPWSEPYYIEGAQGVEPSLFFDDDGKCYYTAVHPNPKGQRYDGDWFIFTQEFDIKSGQLIGNPVDVWNGTMKGVNWPSGPHMYKVGDYYYLLHSEGGMGQSGAVSVVRSRNIYGPFEPNSNNPIFSHRYLGKMYPIQGVGHADMFQASNGDWYMVLLASRPLKGATTLGRETFLARVMWEDGWPVVNPGFGQISNDVIINLNESIPESDESLWPAADKHYEFTGISKLPLAFITPGTPQGDMCFVGEDGLALKCCEKRSYLGIRQDAHNFDAVAVLRTKELYYGAKAGIMLYQNEKNQLYVEFAGVHATVILKTEGKEEKLSNDIAAYNNVSLMFSVRGLKGSVFIGEGNQMEALIKDIDISGLSTEAAGGFVGCTVGIFAGLEEEQKQEEAENVYASFKSFSYRPLSR